MFRSLQAKMVLIMMLLILSVMLVVGTVLIYSVSDFYRSSFEEQMADAFSDELCAKLNASASAGDSAVYNVLYAHGDRIGIDPNRNFYVLDRTGKPLNGSNYEEGLVLELTPNLLAAMNGRVGNGGGESDYMDYALPAGDDFLVYVRDSNEELRDFTWILFTIIVQALLFGLVIAIILSVALSRTVTRPVRSLIKGTRLVAAGDFSHTVEVYSTDEIGQLAGTFNDMAGVLRDTLEDVRSEREKLEQIFLNMTDGVAAFDGDGVLLHINETATACAGRPINTYADFSAAFSQEPDYAALAEEARRGRFQTVADTGARTLDIYYAAFNPGGKKPGIIAVLHDITEQQRLEQARKEFVADVSHELRTPLTSIRGAVETLQEDSEMPPPIRDRFLGIVAGETDRMSRIVSDLLVLSRLDSQKMTFTMAPFSLSALLTRIHEVLRVNAAERRQKLTLTLSPEIGTVTGDAERIEQVVRNIVSNAVHYTPDGGCIDVEAHNAVENGRDFAAITVTDNGIGIPAEDIPRVFERFYRVEKSRSTDKGGTGLGLAIAREIVTAHGGDISLESEPGKGTAVRILLPVRPAAEDTK